MYFETPCISLKYVVTWHDESPGEHHSQDAFYNHCVALSATAHTNLNSLAICKFKRNILVCNIISIHDNEMHHR